VKSDQERLVVELAKSVHPEASYTLSHQVAHLGLLERENAAILNEALKPLSRLTISAFQDALKSLKLSCPLYLTQNDGTLIR
jgi:N-methylhydantoinase A/oxoprolinase/acetone carboxylase beta subunit